MRRWCSATAAMRSWIAAATRSSSMAGRSATARRRRCREATRSRSAATACWSRRCRRAGAPVADPFADFGGLAAPHPPARCACGVGSDGGSARGLRHDTRAARGRPVRARRRRRFRGPCCGTREAAGGIPDDWDPFAPEPKTGGGDFARSLGQPPAGGGRNLGLEVGGRCRAADSRFARWRSAASGGDSLDNLFGLGGKSAGGDPLANSAFDQAAAQPNMAANADPMKSLNSMTRASGTAAATPGPSCARRSSSLRCAAPAPRPPPVAPRRARPRPSRRRLRTAWRDPSTQTTARARRERARCADAPRRAPHGIGAPRERCCPGTSPPATARPSSARVAARRGRRAIPDVRDQSLDFRTGAQGRRPPPIAAAPRRCRSRPDRPHWSAPPPAAAPEAAPPVRTPPAHSLAAAANAAGPLRPLHRRPPCDAARRLPTSPR